ncbi:MAG: hypothetical protein OEV92_01250 [Nitrospinota bacterium]|nr:hypothetical protein [Nitrospinota bacterium]
MVMDVSGDAKILRKGVSAPADLGKSISFDDVFKLGAGAKLAVVTYIDCNQWMMAGPGEFKVNSSQAIEAANGKLAPAKKMPVCYEPDSITAESTNTIGAFVLRGGAKDPVADLRAEFENGNASLSTLMTLVMYDLQNGRKDSARPYFEELSKRAPESQFVKRISGIFRD